MPLIGEGITTTDADVEQPLLKPFTTLGLDLIIKGTQAVAQDCPFCGNEKGKFSVNISNGLWDCKPCGAKGNPIEFVRQFHKLCDNSTKDYSDLSNDRSISPETLMFWGCAKNFITGEWLVPAWSVDGKLHNLYRWGKLYDPEKKTWYKALMSLPGLWPEGKAQGLFGISSLTWAWDDGKPVSVKSGGIIVNEGPWDGMAAWEVLREAGREEEFDVCAVPGANVFSADWCSLFANKQVKLMFDSDHPKVHPKSGQLLEPVGEAGMKRASGVLTSHSKPPASISYLKWSDKGYDDTLPSGWDVRDAIKQAGKEPRKRSAALESLLNKCVPIPSAWSVTPSSSSKGSGIETLQCESWKDLKPSLVRAMRLTDGLERAMLNMLATITSTESVGDQVWMQIQGAAASGKSSLCEMLSTNKKRVLANSTMTGLFSGYKTDNDGEEDHGLVAKAKNKCLIIKDGDTLLSNKDKDKVLGQLRDIYDRVSRIHYGNAVSRNYEGHNMSMILCGTTALRQLDASELGARFLVTEIPMLEEDEEYEIAMRVAHRADREMAFKADGKIETRDGPEMVKAKRLTGGYVEHLCLNAQELLGNVYMSDGAKHVCATVGMFVAMLRARPSIKQNETAQRELCFRLVSQMVRLSKCLAAVLSKDDVDDDIVRRITHVAMDTARGRTLEIVKLLRYPPGGGGRMEGMSTEAIATRLRRDEEKKRLYLDFLANPQVGVVEQFTRKMLGVNSSERRWRLTEKMERIFDEVMVVHNV
jgi:hypothetical protein